MAHNPEDITRTPTYNIHSFILNRWSPRSLTGEELTDEVLMSLFEAARWAPSSYNNQPWRFIYAKRNKEHWNRFFNLLVEGNKVWAKNAAAFSLPGKILNATKSLHEQISLILVRPGRIWH